MKQSLADRAMPDNLTVMEPTNQSRVLQTIIRDQTTVILALWIARLTLALVSR